MTTSDLYRGTFHSQAVEDYDDSLASQVMTTTEDVDLEATDLVSKSAMNTRQVPQSHVELQKSTSSSQRSTSMSRILGETCAKLSCAIKKFCSSRRS